MSRFGRECDPLAWLSEQVKNRNHILSAIQNLEAIFLKS